MTHYEGPRLGPDGTYEGPDLNRPQFSNEGVTYKPGPDGQDSLEVEPTSWSAELVAEALELGARDQAETPAKRAEVTELLANLSRKKAFDPRRHGEQVRYPDSQRRETKKPVRITGEPLELTLRGLAFIVGQQYPSTGMNGDMLERFRSLNERIEAQKAAAQQQPASEEAPAKPTASDDEAPRQRPPREKPRRGLFRFRRSRA